MSGWTRLALFEKCIKHKLILITTVKHKSDQARTQYHREFFGW